MENMQNKPFYIQGLCCLCVMYIIWCMCNTHSQIPVFPTGVDWSQYIMGTEYVWNYDASLHYPTWRSPIYPYLLGLPSFLLSDMTYMESARLFNVLGVALLVISLFLRTLSVEKSITWIGSISMFVSILLFGQYPLIEMLWNSVSPYMLVGGLLAMGLSSVFVFIQSSWGKWIRGVSIGLSWGLATAMDGRSWVFVGVGLLWLVTQEWQRSRQIANGESPRKKGWLDIMPFLSIPILFGLCMLFRVWLENSFQLQVLSLAEQITAQREFLFRDSMENMLFPWHEHNHWVASLCVGTESSFSIASVYSPCSLGMLQVNTMAFVEYGLLPSWYSVGVLIGMLLLGGYIGYTKKWDEAIVVHLRIALQRSIVCVSICLLYILLSTVVWQPPRYLVFIVFPLFGVVAECLDILYILGKETLRVLQQKYSFPSIVGSVISIFVYVAVCVGVYTQQIHSYKEIDSRDYPREWVTHQPVLRNYLSQSVLDCSEEDIWKVHMPIRRPVYWKFRPKSTECVDIIEKENTFDYVFTSIPMDTPQYILHHKLSLSSQQDRILYIYHHR